MSLLLLLGGAGPTVVDPPTSSFVFDDGAPGVSGNPRTRLNWYWDWDKTYFEPRHSPSSAAPTRVVYASPTGTGNGLTSGAPTSLARYLTETGVTQTPGDQVRLFAGTHDINSGDEWSVQGTAANPIRFVRHLPTALAPKVVNTTSAGSSCWGFTDSYYVGIHGIDIDGESRNANIWGLTFGRRFDNDTGMIRCHHVDIWHTEVHHMEQTVTKMAGTQGASQATNGAQGPSYNFHWFGCELHHSGSAPASDRVYNELMYTGDGNTSGDWVDDVTVEASWLHDSPGGEAIDFKKANERGYLVGCRINTIRVHSQAAVTANDSIDMQISHVVVYDVDERTDPNFSIGESFNGNAFWLDDGDIDHVLAFDIGAAFFDSRDVSRGSATLNLENITVWDMETRNNQDGSIHGQTGNTFPAVTIASSCISDDGQGASQNAAASDFVGPLDDTHDDFRGFALAGSSSLTGGAFG